MELALTDLHTHILPAVDDGADNLKTALQMLRAEKVAGVERVALTPHFYPLREGLNDFLERRQRAYAALLTAWDGTVMPSLRLGAEVRYTPALLEMELRRLTVGESDYLLLELADRGIPVHIEQVLDVMLMQGITPILAHVERCEYFRKEPERLRKLVYMGALAQVSAGALENKWNQGFAKCCLESGLAQLIASDAHAASGGRRPCMDTLKQSVDKPLLERAEGFSRAVWDNGCVPAVAAYPVKKGLFKYSY